VNERKPVTILCLASFEKGQDFMRECKKQGARVVLVTSEKLRNADWPRDSIDEGFYMPDMTQREHLINGVSYLARTEDISRIVAMDEYDLEIASALREHLRLPGMGETTVRYFRDKLAMRICARLEGILVPDFVAVINHAAINGFMERVPAPWILKPRTLASSIGIKRVATPDELWRIVNDLGDRQSHHVFEQFVEGDVFHVDSIIANQKVVFSEVHKYARPPFAVYHGGGIFSSRTLDRASIEARTLKRITQKIVKSFGLRGGALHTEFIRSKENGEFYFLETAARVGGANIAEMVEAATGVNLWREWARVEVADARGENYELPKTRSDFAGVLISLARQDWPDTSGYDDPEIVLRLHRLHHAGLVVASRDRKRVEFLLEDYMNRFLTDFHAVLPASETPSA
jgi:biotin carboxylase